jgi:hypothetical protein
MIISVKLAQLLDECATHQEHFLPSCFYPHNLLRVIFIHSLSATLATLSIAHIQAGSDGPH